jgi:enoyl-[acyl-carrier-protein] reductase (NADH)
MELIEADIADTSQHQYYTQELQETRKKMKNIMQAIEDGVAARTVKNRFAELERYELDLLENLEYLQRKKPTLTKEQIIFWLESFKDGDIDDIKYKQRVIDTLIHSIYVYDKDDGGKRLVLNFNTSSNNTTEVDVYSALACSAPPILLKSNPITIIDFSLFAFVIEITV